MLPWGTSTPSVLKSFLSLYLLQLPGCLLLRKGGKFSPQSSHHGQGQLEPKGPGFHHPTWRLPDLRARPDPLWALGRAWPHCQPHSPAPVSMARSPGICPTPLLWSFDKCLWGGGWRDHQGDPLWVTMSWLLYCRNVKISYSRTSILWFLIFRGITWSCFPQTLLATWIFFHIFLQIW